MKNQDPSRDEPLPGAADVKKAYDALPANDVPAGLDARILARAREAASQSDNILKFKLPDLRRWTMPLTAAASVVVVMSVVYETQFSAPRDASVAVTTAMEQGATAALPDESALPAASSAAAAQKKAATARSNRMDDAARTHVIPPPPPVIAPVINLPATVSLAESVAPAPPATGISVPPPSPVPGERADMADELRQEKKEQETRQLETNEAARAAAGAMAAPAQLVGKVEKRAEAKASLAPLQQLAGQYNYEYYRLIMLSGRMLGLKELGATSATLDIDAQGTLTLRMKMTNGKTITQIARILEVKLDGNNGYWIAQWPDMSYPVDTNISFEGNKLINRTQFENTADTPRFGSVEEALLRRITSK